MYRVGTFWCEPLIEDSPDPYPYPDTALLDVDIDDHPWVDCENAEPTLYPEPDRLHCVGWTGAFSRDQPRLIPIALRYEGSFADSDGEFDWRLQLREGQISTGMSGSPVLNQRTGRVCAMTTRTRDAHTDMGGWAVPIARHLADFAAVQGRIPGPTYDRWRHYRDAELFQRFADVLRPAYRPMPTRSDLPPSLLLRTQYAIVPFLGRREEINNLIGWCESSEQSVVQLLVGPAGAGKTRLAAQLCAEMSLRSWTAGFLNQGCKPESFDRMRETGSPLLAVLDYGDAWSDLEQFLIRLAAPAETAPPTRILLLARHSGSWWYRLRTTNPHVTMHTTDVAAATVSPEDLRAAYCDAAEAFRQHLGAAPLDSRDPIPPLQGQPILVVHMAALLRIDAHVGGSWTRRDFTEQSPTSVIVASVLEHEEGYWQRSVTAAGMQIADVVLRRVIALAGLFGWKDEAELAQLLTAVPDLTDASFERRHALARWIMAFYPVQEPRQETILQPDLLLEQLVALALVDCPQLLTPLSAVSPERADRAFTIIDRACREHNPLRWMLEKAVRADLARLGPMILRIGERSEGPLRDEFTRAVLAAKADLPTLEYLLERIPADSVLLQDVAVTIGRRVVAMARIDGDTMLVAATLERLAGRLAGAGRKDKAADVSVEALDLIMLEAQGNETSNAGPLIAQSLATARRLRAADRTVESLAVLQRASGLARQSELVGPGLYLPQHAIVLANLTTTYKTLGRGADVAASAQSEWDLLKTLGNVGDAETQARLAGQMQSRASALQHYIPLGDILTAVSQAHDIRMAIAASSYEPLVAKMQAWRSLAEAYHTLHCNEEALAAGERAENACRQLATMDPENYGEDLAQILSFRANHVNRDSDQAISLLRELVTVRQAICSRRPSRENSHALSRALISFGHNLSARGCTMESIDVTHEGVEIAEKLAEQYEGSELLRLGRALDALTACFMKAHMPDRAVISTSERVSIYRRLAVIDFDRYGRNLVTALTASMSVFQAAGRKLQVRTTAQEVIKISRRIHVRAEHSDVDSTKVFANVGLALVKAGMYDDAVSVLGEVVSLRRERARSGVVGEHAPGLIRALGYYSDALSIWGHWREALPPADEAFAMCAQLLLELPRDRRHGRRKSDTEQFYWSLVRLKGLLEQLGRSRDAVRVRLDGMEILSLLADGGNQAAIRFRESELPKYQPSEVLFGL
jgi:tetratricopeptide (TPR) repeat protein